MWIYFVFLSFNRTFVGAKQIKLTTITTKTNEKDFYFIISV